MRLSDLPNVEFFNTDKEHIQQKVFDIYTTITGRTLGEGDPVTLFLNVISEIIIRLLNDANYAAKQNLLAYAEGDNLDHVGAVPAAVERTAAVCKVLVAQQQTAVAPVDVLEDVLIASIIHTVDDGVAVSCVEGADTLPFLLRDGAERVVNRQPEKDIAGRLTDAERLE